MILENIAFLYADAGEQELKLVLPENTEVSFVIAGKHLLVRGTAAELQELVQGTPDITSLWTCSANLPELAPEEMGKRLALAYLQRHSVQDGSLQRLFANAREKVA